MELLRWAATTFCGNLLRSGTLPLAINSIRRKGSCGDKLSMIGNINFSHIVPFTPGMFKG